MFDILADTKVTKQDATATGTSTATFDVDMLGYDNVTFLCTLGTPNAGNYFKVGQDTDSAYGTVADIASSKVTPTGTNKSAVCITVARPSKRYLRFSAVRAGTTSTLGEAYLIRYNAHIPQPITNNLGSSGASVQFTTSLIDPAEGTP